MKTTQILVKTVLMSMLTAGSFLFAACTDDMTEENFAGVENAEKAQNQHPGDDGDDGDILVEAQAMKVPYTVQAKGAWKVETDDRFYNIDPSEGVGPTEVTIYTQDNTREYRKKGTFRVVEDNGQSTALKLVQKMQAEEPTTRASKIEKQNSVYAIGYGYDCTSRYAHPDGVRCEIFNTEMLADKKMMSLTPLKADLVVHTETGSTMSEITNSLSTKAEVSGGIGKFKGEAKASFDMNTANSHNCEYAINYFDAVINGIKFETSFGQLKEKWMTAEAYEDINGLSEEYAGDDHLAKLVKQYGTHVVMSANLGGRISQSITIDVTNIKTSYDVKAFAQASYGGICLNGKASVEDEFKKSLEENKKSVNTRLNVQGGSRAACNNLVMEGDFTNEHVKDWFNSLDDDNMSLMGFDKNSLIPLYELVDANKYPERRAALEAYIEGRNGQFYEDFDCTIQSTVTSFELQPYTNCSNKNGTLVKDIFLGGQKVGIICNEYVPQINQNERVNVVYPIINGSARFNMGFFLGDNEHRPGRVAWTNEGVTYIENPNLDFGQAKKLYICGVSVAAEAPQDATVKAGKVQDAWMQGLCQVKGGYNKTWDYGLVKIGKYIWTRDNYNEKIDGACNKYRVDQAKKIKIQGWHIATTREFYEMNKMLTKYGASMPALLMYDDESNKANNLTGLSVNFKDCSDKGEKYCTFMVDYTKGYEYNRNAFFYAYVYENGKTTDFTPTYDPNYKGIKQIILGIDMLSHIRMVMDY